MARSIFRSTILAASLFFAPVTSFAQEVFGTLEASLDGAARSWFLTVKDADSQSFALSIPSAGLQAFSLWGVTDAQNLVEEKQSLLVSFDVMTVGGQLMPLNASVMYLSDGWRSGWLADEEDTVNFSLTALKNDDSGVLVEGRFEATAGYSELLSSGESDRSRTMQINGSFKAVLPPSILQKN
jgi:hypothetical protein